MIVIGSDHGGFALKEEIKKHLEDKGVAFTDVGSYDGASVDYPDIAKAACEKIVSGECDKVCCSAVPVLVSPLQQIKSKAFVLAAVPMRTAQN